MVEWNKDERVYIANALSPAKVIDVYLNPVEKNAKVIVPDRALSLAIGKEGQNARLAARLTGWRIDIKSEAEAEQEREQLALEMAEAEERSRERKEAGCGAPGPGRLPKTVTRTDGRAEERPLKSPGRRA